MTKEIAELHIDSPGPKDHSECATAVKTVMRDHFHTDVTVSTAPPIVQGPFTGGTFLCPHDVLFYLEPTGEQIMCWVNQTGE